MLNQFPRTESIFRLDGVNTYAVGVYDNIFNIAAMRHAMVRVQVLCSYNTKDSTSGHICTMVNHSALHMELSRPTVIIKEYTHT